MCEVILNSLVLLVWLLNCLLISIETIGTLLLTALGDCRGTFAVSEALFKGKSVRIVVACSLGSIHYVYQTAFSSSLCFGLLQGRVASSTGFRPASLLDIIQGSFCLTHSISHEFIFVDFAASLIFRITK